jgi:hypothetical protein
MSIKANCKSCGKEIVSGVKTCVHCGKDQRNFLMKNKISIGIVAVIIIAIVNLPGEDKPTVVVPKTGDTKVSTSVAEELVVEGPKIFKVGDVIKLSNFEVKVNKVFIAKGDEYTKATEGNEFLAVDCTIENKSNKEQSISSMMMFKVVDKDGRACEMSISGGMAAKSGQLDGIVGPGRKMTGAYVVEVPRGTTGLQLEFDAKVRSSGQVIIQLN